ncbi:MAG: hypothetical protein LLF97_01925 [Planctomycetaceae bacterium]|nr:hypothetical protein [Planctomycetaceae bacterium]
MNIRLIREVNAPSGRGPGNGMFALQRALRRVQPEWFHLGGRLRADEIPWFWCWEDRTAACRCATAGRPFVLGPNMLFANWTTPCGVAGERELCNAASCRLQFTESAWYRDWILAHCGPAMRAPIVLWPYPIDPLPGDPQPARFDLLIYEKSGFDPSLPQRLVCRWPASVRVRYSRFRRERLVELARRSRACVYLSDNDRGPLALAEIVLSGCPAIGMPRGAPWLSDPRLGFQVERLELVTLCDAIEQLRQKDRMSVAEVARQQFDEQAIIQTIFQALESIKGAAA